MPPKPTGAAAWREYLTPRLQKSATVLELLELLAEQWARDQRPGVRDLRSVARCHILPAFGPMAARDLRPEYLEAWVRALLAEGVAPKHCRKIVSFLSSVLELGIRTGALETNTVRLLPPGTLPPNRPVDPNRAAAEVLQLAQVSQLLSERGVLRIDARVLWGLLLLHGLRFGEAAGLRWGDVSAAAGQLQVRRQWDCKGREYRVPKAKITRDIPLSAHAEPILEDARRVSLRFRGRAPEPSDLVAPYAKEVRGRRARVELVPWVEKTALNMWRADLDALGIAHPPSGPRRIHATRHTFTTLARRAGADPAAVHLITHGSTPPGGGTSARIYTHLDFDSLRGAMGAFDEALAAELGGILS